MDALIRDRSLTGHSLVNAVRTLDPTLSIGDVLEKTRYILLKRVLEDLRDEKFHTGYHVIEYLCKRNLTLEDVHIILEWYREHSNDVRSLIDSGSVAGVYRYMVFRRSTPPWWRRLLPCTRSTQGTGQEP
jgi:hypothetical protein